MQGRGGVVEPPAGFLAGLREACDRAGALLVVDEVFTGLGRTGTMWMCQALDVRPDLLVCGKALGGGLPLSACLGTPELMDRAWGGHGEVAIDTHTHLGSPLSCAAALAVLDEIESAGAAAAGAGAGAGGARRRCARCAGAGWRWACPATRVAACDRLLRRGVIAVPAGRDAEVLEISPPLTIDEPQLVDALALVAEAAA